MEAEKADPDDTDSESEERNGHIQSDKEDEDELVEEQPEFMGLDPSAVREMFEKEVCIAQQIVQEHLSPAIAQAYRVGR